MILIISYHPYLGVGGAERRFLKVIKQWEALDVGFRILESRQPLHPLSRQIPTLLKKDTPSTYVVRGLVFGLLSVILAFKERGFDVVLAFNNDFFSVISAFAISRINRKPCVVIVHHYDIIDGSRLALSLHEMYRLLRCIGYGSINSFLKALATKVGMTIAKKCQATICVSKAFAQLFSNAYLSSNAVERGVMDMVTSGDEEYEACFVGRLDIRKGIIELVDVWKGVASVLPNAKLAIVGYAQEHVLTNLSEIIGSHNLDKNIVFLGPLSDERMYGVIKKSKLFITMSASEGWGMAIAEALACGVPVVCYDIVTLYEQWNRCPYVIFADLHNVEDAAEKIVNFLNSPKPDSQDVKRCVQGLEWEDVARRDLEILRKITDPNRAQRI